MDRRPGHVGLFLLAIALGGLIAGCGESGEGEFRSYSELEAKPEAANGNGSTVADHGSANNVDGHAADRASEPGAAPDRSGAESPLGVSEADAAPVTVQAADPQTLGSSAGAGPVNERGHGPPSEPATGTVPDLGQDPAVRARALGQLASAVPVEAPRPEPREIELLVPHREFRVEGPEEALRVSYDDLDLLKVLNMEPVPADCVDYFPEWLRELDGQRIRIRGFMYPPFETTGIRGFVLARDNQICCMGRYPKRYDVIDVFMRRGVTTDYIQNRPFDVVGVFHIQPEADDGELYQLYVIDDAIIIE